MRIDRSFPFLVIIMMLIPHGLWAQSVIQLGQTRQGRLDETDKRLDSDGSLYDRYVFEGQGGQHIKAEVKSSGFEPYLALMDRDGTELISACPASRTSAALVEITLPYTGKYYLRVNSLHKGGSGFYKLQVKPAP